MFLFATASDLLYLWLGEEYVENSLFIFKVLSLGIIFNFMALLPFTFLQGIGRPDIPAKLHLIELPVYLICLIFLLRHLGLSGAAIAWSFRVVLDCALLYFYAKKNVTNLLRLFMENNLICLTIIFITYVVFLILISVLVNHLIIRLALYTMILIATGLVIWLAGLNEKERAALYSAVRLSR